MVFCSYDFEADTLLYDWSFQKWVSLSPSRTWTPTTNEPSSTSVNGYQIHALRRISVARPCGG